MSKFYKNSVLALPTFTTFAVDFYYGDSRCGFNHIATLHAKDSEGNEIERTNKVHYINRTWESYPGKTAMLGVVYNYASELVDEIAEEYKLLCHRKRLPSGMKEHTLQMILEGDNKIGNTYRNILYRG